jgi:hypothetical protein
MNLRQLRIIFYAGERALTYWSKAALLTGEGTGFGKSVAFALLRDGYFRRRRRTAQRRARRSRRVDMGNTDARWCTMKTSLPQANRTLA